MALTPDSLDPNYKEMAKIKIEHPEYWNEFRLQPGNKNKNRDDPDSKKPANLSMQSTQVAEEKKAVAERSGLRTKKSPDDRKLVV